MMLAVWNAVGRDAFWFAILALTGTAALFGFG
ncbi:hypothetical protein SAMN05192583_0526 [Sphingomonas gellani]|uniref:Uncharacterized protein n=1 Tax=Sphingomonas gellani TaxID=1166340 RepID=A0A1H7Z5Y4_9SPHN|nr:hypothetical protein SAMN05192583_0526 [Sphingomonas gellani]